MGDNGDEPAYFKRILRIPGQEPVIAAEHPTRQAPARYRGRFAPSPTGPLHWGSLATAVLSWVHARRHAGEWLIRIEDLDPPREIPGMARRHLEDLKRYGLESDGEVLWQSQRHDRYRQVLDGLLDRGLAFECRCSRTDLATQDGIHRHCQTSYASTRLPAIRLRVPNETVRIHDLRCGEFAQHLGREVGDVVLRRADGFWAYQLAVVVDDADQHISHVVRGEDLLDSTPRQRYLQRCLGLPAPVTLHLPLLMGADGRKLSKSEGADAPDPQRPLESLRRLILHLGLEQPEASAARSVPNFLNVLCENVEPAALGSPRWLPDHAGSHDSSPRIDAC